MIPYGKQHITQEDIEAVNEVLSSDLLTQGPLVPMFERKFAEYVGARYAVAVSSGTAALHLATLALGVKAGDRVITSPITFAASANAVLYAGGMVDFADIDSETILLDPQAVENLIKAKPKGSYQGIIVVAMGGRPVNLEVYRTLSDKYGLWIIEDACHAPGGYFIDSRGRKQYCGNGKFADISIFSFHPVKHITTGEGGMLTTASEEIYKTLLKLRTHGITKDPKELIENHGGWYYEMQKLGYNYRLTDIQAALGVSQLSRADDGLKRRKEIARRYDEAFRDITDVAPLKGTSGHAYHLYIIETDRRKELYDYLKKHGVFAQVHYIPVHLQPFYQKLGFKKGDFPKAEKYYERCLSLPMYPSLKEAEQEFVIEKVIEFQSVDEK